MPIGSIGESITFSVSLNRMTSHCGRLEVVESNVRNNYEIKVSMPYMCLIIHPWPRVWLNHKLM